MAAEGRKWNGAGTGGKELPPGAFVSLECESKIRIHLRAAERGPEQDGARSLTASSEELFFMAIRWDKLTVKTQQAIQEAQSRAAELNNPECSRCTCCSRSLRIARA